MTKSEVIRRHDVLPLTNKFLKAQGMKIAETMVYQDNVSSMLLEKNGRISNSKQTWHSS